PWSVKLAVVMAAIALLPITIVTGYVDLSARGQFLRDSGARNLQQAASTSELLAKYLDDVVGDVTLLAQGPSTIELLKYPSHTEAAARLNVALLSFQNTK